MADGGATAYLVAASLIATAASTGIAMYSANEQAASQRAIANYNQQINEQNALIARNASIAQAQAAQYNARVAEQMANFRQQAGEEQNRQAIEQANRLRQQRDRLLGLQRSQYAAAGVTEQGSPLAVLADTYTQGELAAMDSRKQGYEIARQQTYQAEMERQAAQYELQTALWDEQAGGAGYRIGMRQAQIQQMAGMAQANATQIGGYASLASGIGSMANTGLSVYGSRPASSGGGYTSPSGPYNSGATVRRAQAVG